MNGDMLVHPVVARYVCAPCGETIPFTCIEPHLTTEHEYCHERAKSTAAEMKKQMSVLPDHSLRKSYEEAPKENSDGMTVTLPALEHITVYNGYGCPFCVYCGHCKNTVSRHVARAHPEHNAEEIMLPEKKVQSIGYSKRKVFFPVEFECVFTKDKDILYTDKKGGLDFPRSSPQLLKSISSCFQREGTEILENSNDNNDKDICENRSNMDPFISHTRIDVWIREEKINKKLLWEAVRRPSDVQEKKSGNSRN